MRPLVLLLLLLGSCEALHAQQQERKLIDRVLQPDMTLANPMQNMAYNSGGANGLDTTKSASVKDYYFTQTFSPKTFETKDFESKSYWQGDFQFATKPAEVKTSSFAHKLFETKSAEVKDAREAGKSYSENSRQYETREAVERGKTSQAHLNATVLGAPGMNMDQVRALLNKSLPGKQE